MNKKNRKKKRRKTHVWDCLGMFVMLKPMPKLHRTYVQCWLAHVVTVGALHVRNSQSEPTLGWFFVSYLWDLFCKVEGCGVVWSCIGPLRISCWAQVFEVGLRPFWLGSNRLHGIKLGPGWARHRYKMGTNGYKQLNRISHPLRHCPKQTNLTIGFLGASWNFIKSVSRTPFIETWPEKRYT